MGNWRRVQVIGTCSAGDADAIRNRLNVDFTSPLWSPLCCGGIAGLPNFGKSAFDVVGNLGERGYGPEDVREAVEALRVVAPSLRCVIHCGADYEGDGCIATVVCDEDGVHVAPPQVETIPEQSAAVAQANMARFLVGMR